MAQGLLWFREKQGREKVANPNSVYSASDGLLRESGAQKVPF